MFTAKELLDAFEKLASNTEPRMIFAGPIESAIFEATLRYQHRNWRRLKREINKAIREAKRESRGR